MLGLALILGAYGGRDHAGSSLARVLAKVIATAEYGFGSPSAHRFAIRLAPPR